MKLAILQSDLLPALSAVSRSAGVRTSLPVLANILLAAENKKLKLSATNLELGVVTTLNCQMKEEGEITVPSRTFLEIVSSLANEKIELEAQGDQLKISTTNFNASLNGISASEFPPIPTSLENPVLVDSQLLKSALLEISFAAAADEGRPILTGILTEVKKDSLELVATDGFRLAHKKAQLKGGSGGGFKSLIPRRTLEEVVRLIQEEEELDQVEVATSKDQNQIVFKINSKIVSSRLIEGQFPSWEKIIPLEFSNRSILDKESLLKATKLASVFARDNANIVKIQSKGGQLTITSEAKELGTQETSVGAQVEGEEIEIAFNSKFLIEALSACPSAQVMIEFSGNLSPALVKGVGEEGLEYVIMPVRLS